MSMQPAEQHESVFTRIADRVSYGMGTPQNIAFWIVAVVAWIALFALGILGANTNILPSWFTSNAFNFPLNTVTTLAELYIGFLVAAAANRSERELRRIIEGTHHLVEQQDDVLTGMVGDEKLDLKNEELISTLLDRIDVQHIRPMAEAIGRLEAGLARIEAK